MSVGWRSGGNKRRDIASVVGLKAAAAMFAIVSRSASLAGRIESGILLFGVTRTVLLGLRHRIAGNYLRAVVCRETVSKMKIEDTQAATPPRISPLFFALP